MSVVQGFFWMLVCVCVRTCVYVLPASYACCPGHPQSAVPQDSSCLLSGTSPEPALSPTTGSLEPPPPPVYNTQTVRQAPCTHTLTPSVHRSTTHTQSDPGHIYTWIGKDGHTHAYTQTRLHILHLHQTLAFSACMRLTECTHPHKPIHQPF